MADPQDQQQQIINAQQAVQGGGTSTFFKQTKRRQVHSNTMASEVLFHKAGATWTDRQAITNVRNTLIGNFIDWFDTLVDFGVDVNVWENMQRSFEIDYYEKPTTTSIVSILPETNQKQDETMNEYFATAMSQP